MSSSTISGRTDAFWNVVRTASLPELGQGPRSGVLPVASLQSRLRELGRTLDLPEGRMDHFVAVGLLYQDHHNEAHDLVQDMTDVDGALIHAIVHRREPDYWNAKYWFRRIGDHVVYRSLAAAIDGLKPAESVRPLARRLTLSGTVDPLGLVDAVESVERRPASDPEVQFLQQLQHAEFDAVVAHLLSAD